MKITNLFAIVFILSAFLVSCEERDNGPLTCKSVTVNDYKLWVGTANGGQEISTNNIPLDQILPSLDLKNWEETKNFNLSLSIQFNSDTELRAYNPIFSETLSCFFRNDTLYIKDGGIYPFGTGNRDILKVSRGMVYYVYQNVREDMMNFQHFTLEDVFRKTSFQSLQSMVPGDTILIYNTTFNYKKD